MTISVEQNECLSHQLILLTQEICKILAKIAQLLGVVEKLSFFLKFFCKFLFILASFPSKLVNIYGIARISQNFDDYPSFHKISGVQHSVGIK